ncbi:MAG: hypothetical protein ABII02_00195 [Candidatus Magasanikbacteria bacterium]
MGKFNKGFLFGGLMGVGLAWLNLTKKGKDVRAQLLDHSAEVYGQIKEKVDESGAVDKITKTKYGAMVKEAVDKYAIENGLADNVKGMVAKLVKSQFKQVKK